MLYNSAGEIILKGTAILKNPVITASVLIYVILSIATLTYFPFMHSDEGWLASLTRSILVETDIGATEDFFHEVNRNPHAIKSLFHLVQIPFAAADFTLFSVRLLSILAGLATLYFLFRSSLLLYHDKLFAVIVVALTAIDIQFIYISHFARQEIIILLVFSICLYIFSKPIENWSYNKDIIIGSILGISIGFHPNIFIIASGFIFLYIFYSVIYQITGKKGKPSFRNTGLLIFILGLFGSIYIILSLTLDPGFISNYTNFGADHGVTSSFFIKLLKLPRFYEKMFFRISGTYYLPDIRTQLIIFSASFLLLIPLTLIVRKNRTTIMALQVLLLGINTGICLIGKYSPPSIIFIFIPGYLITVTLIKVLFPARRDFLGVSIILTVVITVLSAGQILPWKTNSYDNYIQTIKNYIPENKRTLANLNTAFAFTYGNLYSYRDLIFLDQNKNFQDYVDNHKIEYIMISHELGIIFKERPVWNTMYGNIYPWYEDMMVFINTNCEKLYQWNEPVFGMRITSYMGKHNGNITIYKVLKD